MATASPAPPAPSICISPTLTPPQTTPPAEATTTPEAPFPPTPIITLPNITIRPYHPRDIPSLAIHANNPAIAIWMTHLFPTPYTLADSESWVMQNVPSTASTTESSVTATPEPTPTASSAPYPPDATSLTYPPGTLQYAFALPNTDADAHTAIGSIGLQPGRGNGSHSAEVGYWIGEAYWGRGIASAAVGAFVAWAFATVPGLDRINASVYAGNGASAAVLRRVGFLREGVLRRAARRMGRECDLEVWGILRGEVKGVDG